MPHSFTIKKNIYMQVFHFKLQERNKSQTITIIFVITIVSRFAFTFSSRHPALFNANAIFGYTFFADTSHFKMLKRIKEFFPLVLL